MGSGHFLVGGRRQEVAQGLGQIGVDLALDQPVDELVEPPAAGVG